MNLLNNLTGFPAVQVALTAAIMWGTWFISLKYLKEYPIEAFYVVMFAFSLVFVWGVGFLLEGKALLENIALVGTQFPWKIVCTLVGGMLYAAGLWVSLKVMDKVGLALSQPLLQSVTLIAGVLVTLVVGRTARNPHGYENYPDGGVPAGGGVSGLPGGPHPGAGTGTARGEKVGGAFHRGGAHRAFRCAYGEL